MESILWHNYPSESIFDLDWFIWRPEQFSFQIVAADQRASEPTEYRQQKQLCCWRTGLFL